MKLVFRLLVLSCLLGWGCGQKSSAPAPSKPLSPSEPASSQPAPVKPAEPAVPAPAPAPKPPAEPAKSEMEVRLEQMYPMPKYKPLEEIVANWQDVPQKVVDAVKVVTVNVEAEYKLFANGAEIGSSKAVAGHRAKPLKFRPGQLLVTNSRDGNTKAVVAVEDTDFKDQVQALYDEQVEKGRQRVFAARKAAEEALSRQSAGGEVATGFGSAGSDPRFKPAVDYLASGKMITHTLDEAKQWIWLGKETHEGKTYDAILVNFDTETIFGVFPHSMKCLMENGRVITWISAGYGKAD